MAERVSRAGRIRAQNRAEVEILRYKDDHYLWHKHIHNVELDPVQVLKCIDMDKYGFTIDFSCRRTGKTAVKEMWDMKYLACNPDQELGIVAPRMAQSQVNLGYMLDAIGRSSILQNYIAFDRGRRQMADTYFQFANRSKAEAYGIMANVDGGDLTMASLEEVDDMPRDRLYSRFLLMMGSTRRLGASKHAKNDPQIRITGVFKGADTLSELIDSGKYHVLPTVNCHLGVELGIINEAFVDMMREELAPDEYIRQLLCKNWSSRNLIWESRVRKAIQTGINARLELVPPVPGETYRQSGTVLIGYDAGGHGEDTHASKHAAVVIEVIGSFFVFLYARTWSAGADETEVVSGLSELFRYFRPHRSFGDAFGIGVIRAVNEVMLREGVTDIDPQAIGESTASNWSEWYFAPIRFEGMVKHQMAQATRQIFDSEQAAMPYIDDLPKTDREVADMHQLQHQLPNIKKEATSKSYASYKMANKKLGDDLFDATIAGVWAFVNQVKDNAPAQVLLGRRSYDYVPEIDHA